MKIVLNPWATVLTHGPHFEEQYYTEIVVTAQLLSCVQLFATSWTAACQAYPCPSPSPWVCSGSCPLSRWCYLTISSSAASFCSCSQSFPASGFFPVSQLLASGGQGIGASASVSRFSHSLMSDSLQPHGLQHATPPCPSPTPRGCSNSCPSSQWCHPTISSSVFPFSSCLQFFPASGSFAVNQFFKSLGLSIVASASASVLSMNIQGWFPLGLTGLISLLSKWVSTVFSGTMAWKHQSLVLNLLYGPDLTFIHDYGKTIALTIQSLVG